MSEVLTAEICREYFHRMQKLPDYGMQDIRERRDLRVELQNRCNLPELAALNVCNGFYWNNYIYESERREEERQYKESQEGR